MKLKVILIAIFFILGSLFVYSRTGRGISESRDPDLIIFWGNGCSHCEKVKKYIANHNVDKRLKLQLKEVYYHKANQADLEATVAKCPEINSTQGIGVPLGFVVKDQRCLYGDTPIIDYLEQLKLK